MSDTTKIIKRTRTEDALRKAGYQSPDLKPISKAEWDELDEQLAYLRGESRCCASCRGPLLPGQPEGACCKNCTNRIMRTRNYHRREMATIRVLTLVILGCAGGVFLTSILLLVLR